jgi:osmotically-inducible protein OsmY
VGANKIKVETSGGNVELIGNVRNLAEREEAERAAWAAPGSIFCGQLTHRQVV